MNNEYDWDKDAEDSQEKLQEVEEWFYLVLVLGSVVKSVEFLLGKDAVGFKLILSSVDASS